MGPRSQAARRLVCARSTAERPMNISFRWYSQPTRRHRH